jgi:hypothetical protein
VIRRVFVVRAQAPMVPEPAAPGQLEQPATLEALASAPADLREADLGRAQAASH